MSFNVEAETASLMGEHKTSRMRLEGAIKRLASGSKVQGGQANVVTLSKVNQLNSEAAKIRIQVKGIQTRTTWLQIASEHLQNIHQTISEMKDLTIKASGSVANPNDYMVWDSQFQEMKSRISEIVDGFSGSKMPQASFNGQSLLMDFAPILAFDAGISQEVANFDDFNLYTGYKNEAFVELPLLHGSDKVPIEGLPQAGSVSDITLATSASDAEEKYRGWKLQVLSGTGVGQEATVLTYNGATKVATFEQDLGIALDSTSKYILSPPTPPRVDSMYIGTAVSGSTSSMILPQDASGIDGIYKGMTLVVRDGTGFRESAVIDSYDALTREVTFQTPLATALDNTSEFAIISSNHNYNLDDLVGEKTITFASNIWGADNYRLERLAEDVQSFVPVTQEEKDYRAENGIANTVLEPQTDAEKLERRRLNIFDPVYGNIATKEGAMKMLDQLENATSQLSVMITRADAKIGNLKNQYNLFQDKLLAQQEGLKAIDEVNVAGAVMEVEQQNLTQEIILPQLMQRVSATFSGLNRLLQNQGRL